jgi:tetratricopeptide (TPR) repeat protein
VALLEEAVGQGPRNGVVSSYSLWLVYLAEAYLRSGRTSDARAVANRALAMCREHKERGYEAGALYLLGDLAAQGDPPDLNRAESMYREALALVTALGLRPLAARCQLGLGQLYHRAGDTGSAQTHFATAAALFRDLDMPLPTGAAPP